MIDTAEFYENEKEVGDGILNSKKERDSIFVTSKLWSTSGGRNGCIKRLNECLNNLKSNYVDQYLLHAPQGGKVLECYDAMLELAKEEKIRSVGVSNFGIKHLEAIKNSGRPLPAVNQIELHPWCTNEEIVKYCRDNKIGVVGYSPLTKGNKLNDPYLIEVAKRHNKSPAQILIRWSLQKGYVTIPKSSKFERIAENANVFDFSLNNEEMDRFDSFGKKQKLVFAWDPTKNSMKEFGPEK